MDLEHVHRFFEPIPTGQKIFQTCGKKAIENSLAVALLLDDELYRFWLTTLILLFCE